MRRDFQGLCLFQQRGCDFMDHYDVLPPDVRHRLANSPFNLCTACVHGRYSVAPYGTYYDQINIMEEMIRESFNG